MTNSNKKTKKHKASYLVSRFLNSRFSYELGIDIYDIGILTRCAEMMDNNKTNNEKTLYGCQDTIARKCRIDRKSVNRRLKKYVTLKILNQITFNRNHPNKFTFGEAITYGKSADDNYEEFTIYAE